MAVGRVGVGVQGRGGGIGRRRMRRGVAGRMSRSGLVHSARHGMAWHGWHSSISRSVQEAYGLDWIALVCAIPRNLHRVSVCMALCPIHDQPVPETTHIETCPVPVEVHLPVPDAYGTTVRFGCLAVRLRT